MVENTGLGNQILLSKIDELRELGISSEIPLPQVGVPLPMSIVTVLTA